MTAEKLKQQHLEAISNAMEFETDYIAKKSDGDQAATACTALSVQYAIEVLEELKYTDKRLKEFREPATSAAVVFNIRVGTKLSELKQTLQEIK